MTRKTLLELPDPQPPGPPAPKLPDHPAYQQIMAVFATADAPLRARQVCQAMDLRPPPTAGRRPLERDRKPRNATEAAAPIRGSRLRCYAVVGLVGLALAHGVQLSTPQPSDRLGCHSPTSSGDDKSPINSHTTL